MWHNSATQANVATLRSRGVLVLEPDNGRLTGADTGPGRLPTPEAITQTALALAPGNPANLQALHGRHVVITAGGTREPIDPVRYIGNHSSGKQGIALAHAASAAGARVTLIGANLESEISGIDVYISVETAEQLAQAVNQQLPSADVLIMAAAVSDFRVESPLTEKLKRHVTGGEYELRLVENQDILAGAVERVRAEELHTYTVGFAAETAGTLERLASLAATKIAAKGCDLLVANDVSGGAVFGSSSNSVYLLAANGSSGHVSGTKLAVAIKVLETVASALSAR
jgi:phosphopantothenoylcysteine decarboxylase/phosphopantothenate--cysteine ligase